MEQYGFLESLLQFEEHFSFFIRYPSAEKLSKQHIERKLPCNVAICSKNWQKLIQCINTS